MGTKRNPGRFDCYHEVMPDEPIFVLRAKDPVAPEVIEFWAERWGKERLENNPRTKDRLHPERVMSKQDEALKCAAAMREWRKANPVPE